MKSSLDCWKHLYLLSFQVSGINNYKSNHEKNVVALEFEKWKMKEEEWKSQLNICFEKKNQLSFQDMINTFGAFLFFAKELVCIFQLNLTFKLLFYDSIYLQIFSGQSVQTENKIL